MKNKLLYRNIILIAVIFVAVIAILFLMSKQWGTATKGTETAVHNYNNGVRAERLLMYDKVQKSDKMQLIHGDNQSAITADQQAQANGQAKPYKKNSDGNYWDWFSNHKSLPHGDGNTSFIASILGTDHPHRHIYFVDNQKILRRHGVTSGVNFN